MTSVESDEAWIRMIESDEALRIRGQDIYPKLRDWIERAAPRTVLEIGAGPAALCGSEPKVRPWRRLLFAVG